MTLFTIVDHSDNLLWHVSLTWIMTNTMYALQNLFDLWEDLAEKLRKKDKEIAKLKKKLSEATKSLESALSAASIDPKSEGIDLGSESPLNLFIQCFKKKYDISVNPNDIAIFV